MARKTEVFQLKTDTYRITQLGAEEGSELYDEILATVGSKVAPKLQELAGLDQENDDRLETALGALLFDLLATVPKELKRRWRHLFQRTTEVQAGEVWLNMADARLFNEHFAGRYGAMTAWELACLKHNFMDFLPSAPGPGSSDSGSKQPTTTSE